LPATHTLGVSPAALRVVRAVKLYRSLRSAQPSNSESCDEIDNSAGHALEEQLRGSAGAAARRSMPEVCKLLHIHQSWIRGQYAGGSRVGVILEGSPAIARAIIGAFTVSLRLALLKASQAACGQTASGAATRTSKLTGATPHHTGAVDGKMRCLVVSSANNLRAWRNPLYRHASQNDVAVYHGGSQGERRLRVHRLQELPLRRKMAASVVLGTVQCWMRLGSFWKSHMAHVRATWRSLGISWIF